MANAFRGILCAAVFLLPSLLAGTVVAAQADEAAARPATDAPSKTEPEERKPETPRGSFELVEWVVLVVDANRPNANDAVSFKSTAPGFARGRRAPADAAAMKDPSPVGVIRLLAAAAPDEEPIDVLLQVGSGRFLGSWPQGKPKNNRLLWDKVTLGEGRGKPVPVDAGHWFETLRKPGGRTSALSGGRWSERFLMYDAEVAYPNALRVRAGQGPVAYRVANAGPTVMRDVQVYVPAEGGWRVGRVDELPAGAPAAPAPAAAPASQPAATATTAPAEAEVAAEVFAENAAAEKAAPAVVPPPALTADGQPGAATQPAAQPAPALAAADEQIASEVWRDVTLAGDAKALPASDAVAGWGERLAAAGLSPADVEVVLATLRTHALDAEQLTVVYRMDQAELDRLLPLEVVPAPVKITRVGIAVVRGVDPAAGERIARLIEQLGSEDWDQREAAHTKLAQLGAGAGPKLNEALKHQDIEVVYRAERLLEAIGAQAPPPQAGE